MQQVSAAELIDRLSCGGGIDDLVDDLAVAVDCAAGLDATPDLVEQLVGWPIVFVAVGAEPGHPVASALDVVAADDDELAGIEAAIETHPHAAIALAVLLRGAAGRSIPQGLVAESTTYAVLQAGPDHRSWLDENARLPDEIHERDPIVVNREGRTLFVTLNRPEVRNAFNAAMRDALVDAFSIAVAEPELEIVVDGNGASFCAGGDLDEFGTTPNPATAHLVRLRRSAGRALAGVADRVTVNVHGSCVGAGVELPSFAGRVVAHPEARFWLPEIAMGLVPGAGGTVSIPRRIGRQRTMAMALSGAPVDAPTALDWGLVDEIR